MFNPALMAALQNKESEDFLQKRLKAAEALGASSAIPLALDEKQQKLLDQAIGQGTVIRTVDGRFYLNERAVNERKEGQKYMALLILLIAGSVIASVAILASRANG